MNWDNILYILLIIAASVLILIVAILGSCAIAFLIKDLIKAA